MQKTAKKNVFRHLRNPSAIGPARQDMNLTFPTIIHCTHLFAIDRVHDKLWWLNFEQERGFTLILKRSMSENGFRPNFVQHANCACMTCEGEVHHNQHIPQSYTHIQRTACTQGANRVFKNASPAAFCAFGFLVSFFSLFALRRSCLTAWSHTSSTYPWKQNQKAHEFPVCATSSHKGSYGRERSCCEVGSSSESKGVSGPFGLRAVRQIESQCCW